MSLIAFDQGVMESSASRTIQIENNINVWEGLPQTAKGQMNALVTVDTAQHCKYVQQVKRLFPFVPINKERYPLNKSFRLGEEDG